MPLPVAHGMAGISIYFWGHEIRFFKSRFITVLFFAFVACLPDADFLPGWLRGIRTCIIPSGAILWALLSWSLGFLPGCLLAGTDILNNILLSFFHFTIRI